MIFRQVYEPLSSTYTYLPGDAASGLAWRNPRRGGETTLEQFRVIMANLRLPSPKFIDYAVFTWHSSMGHP